MKHYLALSVILTALFSQATHAPAAILLDNTSGTIDTVNAYSFEGGFTFTPNSDYTLTALTLGLASSSGDSGPRTFNVSLWNTDGITNRPSGTVLATAIDTVIIDANLANTYPMDLTSNATGSWDVTAGTQYALTLTPDQYTRWSRYLPSVSPTTSNAVFGGRLYKNSSGWQGPYTSNPPVIQLTGTAVAVPEPSTWALAIVGGGGAAWGMARRRRAAGRVRQA